MLGETLKRDGSTPLARWVFFVAIALLLMFAVDPALAIPQSESTTITLPARPIRSDSNSTALSLPARSTERMTYAYTPQATPAVITISAPTPVAEPSIAYDPTGPSSLALLAIGLGLTLWVVRSRRWVR